MGKRSAAKSQITRLISDGAIPILVIAGLFMVLALLQYHRYENTPVTVEAGRFNDSVSSRVLLQKLSNALKTHPKHQRFQVNWTIYRRLSATRDSWMEFSFRYNRKTEVFEQVCGIFRGFRYGNVNERTIHIIANKEMGVPLTMTNYVNDLMGFDEKEIQKRSAAAVPMFAVKQRRKYFMTFSPNWEINP